MTVFIKAVIAAAALTCLSQVRADVLDAAPGGFSTQTVIETMRDRVSAYEAFVQDIGQWWNPDHTVSGTSAALYLDPRPMGCFCESLGTGAGLVHMTVTFANPGVMLRLSGGLGPLGLLGVAGNLTVEFEDIPEGMKGITITSGTYNQRTVKGSRTNGFVTKAWMDIWQSDLDRNYQTDFEIYGEKAQNPEDMEVDIFVGVK